MSTLLLVLIFLLVVFVVSEFFLSRALSEGDLALERLNQQLAELTEQLSLEQQANNQLRGDITQLSAQLQNSTLERDRLIVQLSETAQERDSLRDQLNLSSSDIASAEDDKEDLRLQLAAAMTMLEAERARNRSQRDKTAEARTELLEEQQISAAARRQITLLNQQIAALRIQLASLQEALDASEAEIEQQTIQIADLGRKLNVALANKVEELSRYRSEFFGRLREILANRSEVSIQGDRFVIQSGVLFESGSAELGAEGQRQIADLADLLLEISEEIPDDIAWILRIDGHTDKRPINTPAFSSNWELSAARAIRVARFLESRGVPPNHLAATGFAAFQPLDSGETDEAFRRNRRIEFKLTER